MRETLIRRSLGGENPCWEVVSDKSIGHPEKKHAKGKKVT